MDVVRTKFNEIVTKLFACIEWGARGSTVCDSVSERDWCGWKQCNVIWKRGRLSSCSRRRPEQDQVAENMLHTTRCHARLRRQSQAKKGCTRKQLGYTGLPFSSPLYPFTSLYFPLHSFPRAALIKGRGLWVPCIVFLGTEAKSLQPLTLLSRV